MFKRIPSAEPKLIENIMDYLVTQRAGYISAASPGQCGSMKN
jgi:hypothetical protein